MTPEEAYKRLVEMADADIDNQQHGRVIVRHIIDTIEDAVDRNDLFYVQEFLALAKTQDIGPRYAIAILRTALAKRNLVSTTWYELRDNCWAYMVEIDKPGRVRLMRGLIGVEE